MSLVTVDTEDRWFRRKSTGKKNKETSREGREVQQGSSIVKITGQQVVIVVKVSYVT